MRRRQNFWQQPLHGISLVPHAVPQRLQRFQVGQQAHGQAHGVTDQGITLQNRLRQQVLRCVRKQGDDGTKERCLEQALTRASRILQRNTPPNRKLQLRLHG